MRAFVSMHAIEESGGCVQRSRVEGALYGLDDSGCRHLQVRTLSLQLVLAGVLAGNDDALGPALDRGGARGEVGFVAFVQTFHVNGMKGEWVRSLSKGI